MQVDEELRFLIDLHTRRPLTQNDHTRSCINAIVLRMSTECSKHVEDSNKHIIEESVCQFGYLPELYEDARSEKHKNLGRNLHPPSSLLPLEMEKACLFECR